VPEAIYVSQGVLVPPAALETRAVRASGPGGQNVNKVASKIELRVDLARIQGMDPASRERLARIVARRTDNEGRLVVTSQRTRDQHRNLEDARSKIRNWIAQALIPEKKRHATRPGRQARERRLRQKHQRSQLKHLRGSAADSREE
jgi:ribosome-associated protein